MLYSLFYLYPLCRSNTRDIYWVCGIAIVKGFTQRPQTSARQVDLRVHLWKNKMDCLRINHLITLLVLTAPTTASIILDFMHFPPTQLIHLRRSTIIAINHISENCHRHWQKIQLRQAIIEQQVNHIRIFLILPRLKCDMMTWHKHRNINSRLRKSPFIIMTAPSIMMTWIFRRQLIQFTVEMIYNNSTMFRKFPRWKHSIRSINAIISH